MTTAPPTTLTTRYLAGPGRRPLALRESDRLDLVRRALEDRFLSRPVFLTEGEAGRLERDLNGVTDLLFGLPERLFDGDPYAFAAAVGLRPEQARLALRPPVAAPGRIGRADLYRDQVGFRLLEFNISSALGGLQITELNRLALADPELAAFVAAEGLGFPDTVAMLAGQIREAAGRAGETCRVALMDCPSGYRATEPEITALAGLLAHHGVEAFGCHTGQARESGGRLMVDGRQVDLVYRYFTLGELTADAAALREAEALLDLFARCDVPVLSPLRTSMHGNKRALALLWEDRCQETLDAGERDLVGRLLPWTHELRPGTARVAGEPTDLLAYCRHHRDRLVIKPAHGLGGSGTVLGRSVGDAQWAASLERALATPHIVQELVTPLPEPFPGEEGADEPWVLNWGAFLIGRSYAGAFLRGLPAGRADVVSYAAGAHAGCAFQQRMGAPS
ncbi:hypothetical protein E5082_04255 [Streptomyces griseoluteus]|uniref:Glutathionylspermidine synthase pre-ATP-grasp-like domain-containing protein n=1 Tax=Streptomyces griseoluteus TaxID=29306 RepID=A0A4Z1DT04_STRGP|nr:circularly permuted type 2 ATP-grasp protein [Streptomyces griseoluteus]TGN87613.1 hypothetical protein E5082_04255 [Streptomyces griseoluteus]GHF22893.1 hypothetical protein GCM10017776_46440 [Streptomyces griseoluteus]